MKRKSNVSTIQDSTDWQYDSRCGSEEGVQISRTSGSRDSLGYRPVQMEYDSSLADVFTTRSQRETTHENGHLNINEYEIEVTLLGSVDVECLLTVLGLSKVDTLGKDTDLSTICESPNSGREELTFPEKSFVRILLPIALSSAMSTRTCSAKRLPGLVGMKPSCAAPSRGESVDEA